MHTILGTGVAVTYHDVDGIAYIGGVQHLSHGVKHSKLDCVAGYKEVMEEI